MVGEFRLHYCYSQSRMLCAELTLKGPRGQKRPADVIGNAVQVKRIATGEIEESGQTEDAQKGRSGRAAPDRESGSSALQVFKGEEDHLCSLDWMTGLSLKNSNASEAARTSWACSLIVRCTEPLRRRLTPARKHLTRLTIWWENEAHTIVTAYKGGVSCGTGSGLDELSALWDLWSRLGDRGEEPTLLDTVAAIYRSLSGGGDIAALHSGCATQR